MYSNFIVIDNQFLSEFSEDIRDKAKENMNKICLPMSKDKSDVVSIEDYFLEDYKPKYKIIYCYCPKCRKSGFLGISSDFLEKTSIRNMRYCVSCGEPNIGYRFKTGYDKIVRMINLSNELYQTQNKEITKDLNHQIVVMMSSVLEIYLRDYYIGVLNTRYIKHHRSLADKFIKDCKNDFLNPDKANDRFKKELDINIKVLIGIDKFKILKEISAYRNVIVHNNGFSDKTFIDTGIGNYKERDLVSISSEDLQRFSTTLANIVDIIDLEYHNIILKELVHEFEFIYRKTQF